MTTKYQKVKTFKRGVPSRTGKGKRRCMHCGRLAVVRAEWKTGNRLTVPVRYCQHHADLYITKGGESHDV
jgi:hypothetical protein